MARTMTANVTGARLREVEGALREARGAKQVEALMKLHPNEVKVLQHLFDERRAGRPAPFLERIARVMVWSDGAMEFRLVDSPATSVPSGASGVPSRLDERDRHRGVPPSPVSRPRVVWSGGTTLPPTPRQFRRRPGDEDDGEWADAPHAGDGWSVVRPGAALPMDPGALGDGPGLDRGEQHHGAPSGPSLDAGPVGLGTEDRPGDNPLVASDEPAAPAPADPVPPDAQPQPASHGDTNEVVANVPSAPTA